MIFNNFDFNLHKKINLQFIFYVIYYCSSNLISIPYYIPFFYSPHFLTFYLLLLKSFTFIRSLHIHLYRNNINLKIDIPYSLPLPYKDSSMTSCDKLTDSPAIPCWVFLAPRTRAFSANLIFFYCLLTVERDKTLHNVNVLRGERG